MKKRFWTLVLALLLVCCALPVCAAQDETQAIGADTAQSLQDLLDYDTAQTLSDFGLDTFDPRTVFDLSWDAVKAFFSETLRDSLQTQSRSFLLLLTLLLFMACVGVLLEERGMRDVFSLCAVCVLTIQTAVSMHTLVSAAAASLQTVATFMKGFIPVYAGLLAFSGHPAGALGYQSLCFALSEGISWFSADLCVPLLGVFFCLMIAFSMSETVNAAAFINGVNKVSAVVLGLLSGVFAGVLSIRSVMAASVDSVAAKSTRFLVGSLIPVIGSAMSDAYSAVLGSIDLIKGSAAVFAIAVLLVLQLPLLLQLLVQRVMLGSLSAIGNMLSENRAAVLLSGFAAGVRLLLLLCVFECFLFVITTGLMLRVR